MEIVIVMCLLIVIVLLLHDKVTSKGEPKKAVENKADRRLPDIIGDSKRQRGQLAPNSASDSQHPDTAPEVNNFDVETKEKDYKRQIPQEELDDIFSPVLVDLEEEEEEWDRYGFNNEVDAGFAQGVTFEELAAVGRVIREETAEPSMQIKAAEIVHKIQGTELFALLENSTEDASRLIAGLLDSRLSLGADSGSSAMRNDFDLNGFDIGEFV